MPQPSVPRTPPDADPDALAPPLSVDAALLTLAPRFRTERPLTVSGKVLAVRTHEPFHYVDLSGADAQLTCRLDAGTPAPAPGQGLVVHGVLSVQPSRFKGGLEVLLTGTAVGTYHQVALPGSRRPLARTHTPLRLARLVALEPPPLLGVIATTTAWEDARRAALAHELQPRWERLEGNFGSRAEMIRLLHSLADDPDYAAVAVLRGGGDARGLEMWDDPDVVEALLELGRPVYTALGHSTHLLLADRYADETFDTPGAFGHAVGQVLQERRTYVQHVHAVRAERDALARELAEARQSLAGAQAAAQAKERERRLLRRAAIVLAAVALVLLAALVLG